jgi:hypothetical protein
MTVTFLSGLSPSRSTYPQGIPPDVCLYFEKLALDLIRDGHKRYSADGILHRVRWHWQVERGDRGFKCNNNWSAPLARWFIARNPSAKGFFETRIAKPVPVRAYAD